MGRSPGSGTPSLEEKQRELENFYAAQFNTPFNFALLAYRIPRGVEWTDPETRRNPEILNFMDKVGFQADPEFAESADKAREIDPKVRPAKVTVTAKGQTIIEEIKYRRGDSFTDVYWTQEDAIGKFRHNVERIVSGVKTDRAVETLLALDELDTISDLINEITP